MTCMPTSRRRTHRAAQAFVLFAFYQLMLSFLGGRHKLAERLRARTKERARPLLPCLKGWRMGSRFVHRTTVGVYQCVGGAAGGAGAA